MEKINIFIEKHFNRDKTRSSLSNLIKKIKLDSELLLFVDNYLDYGSFKQKLYHIIKNLGKEELYCFVCNTNKIKWIENNNFYRKTCSANCCGKLSNTKNPNNKKYDRPLLNNNNEFLNYFTNNKIKLTESNLLKIYPKLVNDINLKIKFNTDSFSEKVYFYLNNIKYRPLCKHCNYNTVSFDTFSKGYHKYCSIKCSSNSIEKKMDIENTCLERYGVKNIGEVTREKAVNTMIEIYGDHISKTEQYKKKFKETSIKNYGVDHPFKSDIVIKLIKDTCDKRYGDDYTQQKADKMIITKKERGLIYKWTSQDIKDIKSYRRSVSYYTEKSYNENKHILNPDNLERGIKSNHIDHIFPVIEGWKNRVDPKDISHYKNLRIISSYDNLSKGERTDIDIESFFDMIN
jgi:hypothetical protein